MGPDGETGIRDENGNGSQMLTESFGLRQAYDIREFPVLESVEQGIENKAM